MSYEITSLSRALDQSANSVFFERPIELFVNEDAVANYASSLKIEKLITELQKQGPLVASAQMGPKSYLEAPFKLGSQVCNQDIYGWKPCQKPKKLIVLDVTSPADNSPKLSDSDHEYVEKLSSIMPLDRS